MLKKIPLKRGDEYDAFTPFRRYYNWPAGTRKRIKKKFNKRFRYLVKQEVREVRDA